MNPARFGPFIGQPPTVRGITPVDFPYTGDQGPRISSSPNGGDYGAPSDSIGNNLRLLFAHTRLRCAR